MGHPVPFGVISRSGISWKAYLVTLFASPWNTITWCHAPESKYAITSWSFLTVSFQATMGIGGVDASSQCASTSHVSTSIRMMPYPATRAYSFLFPGTKDILVTAPSTSPLQGYQGTPGPK